MATFRQLTKPQQRQLAAGYAARSTPLRVRMRDGQQHDLVLLGVAQEERSESDPYSQRGSLLMARFYWTRNYLVLRLSDVEELELLPLSTTNPDSPEYEPEPQVVRPLPPEAMAARQRRSPNRHDQL